MIVIFLIMMLLLEKGKKKVVEVGIEIFKKKADLP